MPKLRSFERAAGALFAIAAAAMLPTPAWPQDQVKITTRPYQGVFTVKAPGQLDVAIIDAVADIGAQQVAELPALGDVWEVIVNKCGRPSVTVRIHPRYREKFFAANAPITESEISPLVEARSFNIPACARFALTQGEFDIPNGIQALMAQLNVPFDLDRFRQLTAGQNFRANIDAAFQRLQANPNPGGEACPATEMGAFFACVNTIEFAKMNSSLIKSADKITGKVRVAVASSGQADIQIPIAKEKADTIGALVNKVDLTFNASALAYKAMNKIANIIPVLAKPEEGPKPIENVTKITVVTAPNAAPLPAVAGGPNQPPAPLPPANAGATGSVENPINFVTAVNDAASSNPACTNAGELNKGRWPFDVDLFLRVSALNSAAIRESNSTRSPSRTLVVDTGFDFTFDPNVKALVPEKYYFPRHNLAVNDRQLQGTSGKDTDGDGINDNFGWAGINLASKTRSSDTSVVDGDRRSHGLSVTTLVLGGRDDRLRLLRGLDALPIKVGTASLVAPGTASEIVQKDYLTRIFVYAKANDLFRVVNLSLSTRDQLEGFQGKLDTERGLVFVVAAGNNTQGGKEIHLTENAVYPALLGGNRRTPNEDGRSIVITVGAHKGNGKIAKFSNYSKEAVDVLAPGCGVPSYDLRRVAGSNAWETPARAVEAEVSGTSFAAPVVSFAVSLLMSDGAFSRPGVAKERVLVGTDFDAGLVNTVYSSGRFNIGKMLGYRFDIIETRPPASADEQPGGSPPGAAAPEEEKDIGLVPGRLQFGTLLNADAIPNLQCREDTIEFRHVRKLAYDKKAKRVLLVSSTNPADPRALKRQFCEPSTLDNIKYSFLDEETGVSVDVSATDVADLVRRF